MGHPASHVCENLTVPVTAENLFFNATPVGENFMTVDPGKLPSINIPSQSVTGVH